ncbi:MAG: LamG-like jellyroll fold domain-containing protein [Planctomycetota bacterium]
MLRYLLLAACFVASMGYSHAHDPPEQTKPRVFSTRQNTRVIPPTAEEDAFQFVIYGDRTGGVPAGLKVLEQAVGDTNLLDPDLVMTVGDLIQGYNETEQWLEQAAEYRAIMKGLRMPWFPVAGNHDVYWRGQNPAPPGHHEANYERHFGPLWYSFRHKNAGFIVLYSDEGDPKTNLKAFNIGKLQQMSANQLNFLDRALKEFSDQDHVFVFLHHPRWTGGGYTGSNWDAVHKRLVDAGNVSGVFAGHIHRMRYDPKDGIEYFALATTGGHVPGDTPIPDAGYLHHFNVVTVRPKGIQIAALPVGSVFDPKRFTQEFLAEVELAKSARVRQSSEHLMLNSDGSSSGSVRLSANNPSGRVLEVEVYLSLESLENDWTSTLDHLRFTLEPKASREFEFDIRRAASTGAIAQAPRVAMTTRLLADEQDVAVQLPEKSIALPLRLGEVPSDYFSSSQNHALLVDKESAALAISDDAFDLPDGPFTVEVWVNPIKQDGYDAIVAKTESSEYAIFSDHGAVRFDVHVGGKYVSATSAQKLPENQWSHVAGVYDGKNVSLFIDGKRIDSKTARGARRGNRLPLYLGADPNRSGQPTRSFTGQLDEFRLSAGARYGEDFSPERRLEPDDQTVILHHLDRAIGPFLLDHSDSAANAMAGPDTRLVPVD